MSSRLAWLLGTTPEPPTPLTDWTVTVALLDRPWAYRQRTVDEVTLQTEGLYALRRSVQCEPIRPVLTDYGIRVGEGALPAILPLSLMPKAALLEFDVTGPDGNPAHFVSRSETANRQVDFLRLLAQSSGVPAPDEVLGLLFGSSLFTPGMLDGAKLAHEKQPDQLAYALRLAYDRPFEAAQVIAWQGQCTAAGKRLAGVLGAPPSLESSSENPLLALLDGPDPDLTDDDITDRLTAYVAWQDDLAEADATNALLWLSTFGRRYVALIDTVIDPDRPALLKMSERRQLPLGSGAGHRRGVPTSRRFRCQIHVETHEARSYHLRIRSEDDSVHLFDVPVLQSEDGEVFGANYLDATAYGSDGYALYSSDPERPGHVIMTIPLRLSGDVRRSLTLVYFLAFAAAAFALLPIEFDEGVIGLITLPATFSATVLLVRERTTLSARMLRDYKWALVFAVIVLWAVSLARVADWYPPGAGGAQRAPAATPSANPSTSVSSPPPRPSPSRAPRATPSPAQTTPSPVRATPHAVPPRASGASP